MSLFVRCVPGDAPLAPADPGNIRIYGGILGVLSQTLPVETTDAETIGVFRGRSSRTHRTRRGVTWA